MEFPIEIQRHINDFAKPLTRPDWRQGSAFNRKYIESQYSTLEIDICFYWNCIRY
jgi:hypothetical protein